MLGCEIENPNGVLETFLTMFDPQGPINPSRIGVKKLGMGGFSCEKQLFWPYSALGALFGRRRSEIKVLQVLPLSVPHQRSHFDATVHFIFACVPCTQRPQVPGLM